MENRCFPNQNLYSYQSTETTVVLVQVILFLDAATKAFFSTRETSIPHSTFFHCFLYLNCSHALYTFMWPRTGNRRFEGKPVLTKLVRLHREGHSKRAQNMVTWMTFNLIHLWASLYFIHLPQLQNKLFFNERIRKCENFGRFGQ